MEKKLTQIAAQRSDVSVHEGWFKPHELDTLTEQVAGLFIFAATVIKFIDSGGGHPRHQLDRVLHRADKLARHNTYRIGSLHADVDALYAKLQEAGFA